MNWADKIKGNEAEALEAVRTFHMNVRASLFSCLTKKDSAKPELTGSCHDFHRPPLWSSVMADRMHLIAYVQITLGIKFRPRPAETSLWAVRVFPHRGNRDSDSFSSCIRLKGSFEVCHCG